MATVNKWSIVGMKDEVKGPKNPEKTHDTSSNVQQLSPSPSLQSEYSCVFFADRGRALQGDERCNHSLCIRTGKNFVDVPNYQWFPPGAPLANTPLALRHDNNSFDVAKRQMRRRKHGKLWSGKGGADAEQEMASVVQGLQQRQVCDPVPGRVMPTFEAVAESRLLIKSHVESRCELPGIARSTFLMVFSPDGGKIASTHGNHSVYVTDVKTGKNLSTLSGHPRTPWCIAFHPSSNQILATGCLGGQVRVWDLHGGSEMWMTRGETVIASLAFHPVDHVLVIATYNELYFWDWSKPVPFAKCHTANEKEKVRYVSFDQSGHQLVTGISNTLPHVTQWDRGGPDDWSSPGGRPGDEGGGRSFTSLFRTLLGHYEQLMKRLPPSRPASVVDRGTDPMEMEAGTSSGEAAGPTRPASQASNSEGGQEVDGSSLLENFLLEADDIMLRLGRRTQAGSSSAAGPSEDAPGPSADRGRLGSANGDRQGSCRSCGSFDLSRRDRGPVPEVLPGQDLEAGSVDSGVPPRRHVDERDGSGSEDLGYPSCSFRSDRSAVNQQETELALSHGRFVDTLRILEVVSKLNNQCSLAGRNRKQLISSLLRSVGDSSEDEDVVEPSSAQSFVVDQAASIAPAVNVGGQSSQRGALNDNASNNHSCRYVSENSTSLSMPGSIAPSEEEPTLYFVQRALRNNFENLIDELSKELSKSPPGQIAANSARDQELIRIQANLSKLRTLCANSSLIRDSFNGQASDPQSSGGGGHDILDRIDRASTDIAAFRSLVRTCTSPQPVVFNSSLYEKLKRFFEQTTVDRPEQNGSDGQASARRDGVQAPDVGEVVSGSGSQGSTSTRDVGLLESSVGVVRASEPCAGSSVPPESNVLHRRITQIVESASDEGLAGSSGEGPTSRHGHNMAGVLEPGHSSELPSARHRANMHILEVHERVEPWVKSLNSLRCVVKKLMRLWAEGDAASGGSACAGHARAQALHRDIVVLASRIRFWKSLSLNLSRDVRSASDTEVLHATALFELSLVKLQVKSAIGNFLALFSSRGETLRAAQCWEKYVRTARSTSLSCLDKLNRVRSRRAEHGGDHGSGPAGEASVLLSTNLNNSAIEEEIFKFNGKINAWNTRRPKVGDRSGSSGNSSHDGAAGSAADTGRPGGCDLGEPSTSSRSDQGLQIPLFVTKLREMMSDRLRTASTEDGERELAAPRCGAAGTPVVDGEGPSSLRPSAGPEPERNHRGGGWTYFPKRQRLEERFYVSPRSAFQPHTRRSPQPGPGEEVAPGSLGHVEESIDRLRRNLDDTLRLCRARLEVLELYELQNLWEDLRTHIRSLHERVRTLRESPGPRGDPSAGTSLDTDPEEGRDAVTPPGTFGVVQCLRSVMSRMNRRLSITRRHYSVATRSLDSRNAAAPHRRSCGSLRVQTYLLKERPLGADSEGGSRGPTDVDKLSREDGPAEGTSGTASAVQPGVDEAGPSLAPGPAPAPAEPFDRDAASTSTQPLWTMVRHLESMVVRHNEQQQRFQRELAELRASRQRGSHDDDLYELLQLALQITGVLLTQLVTSSRRMECPRHHQQHQEGTPGARARRHRAFMVPTVRVNDVPVGDAGGPRSPPPRRASRLGSPPLAQRFQYLYGDGAPYVRPRFLHPRYVAWSSDPFAGEPDNPYLGPPVIVRDLSSPQTHRIQVWDFSQFHVPDISKADENVVVSECKIHNDASVDISVDGSMLVALLPSDRYENIINTLGIYSLVGSSRGQCLYTTNFEQNAVSVSFSPTGRHLLVGVAINRATLLTTDSNFLARVYRLGAAPHAPGTKGRLLRVRNFERTREHAYMSVNCIRWLPGPGQGFVYGTNTGQLRILR